MAQAILYRAICGRHTHAQQDRRGTHEGRQRHSSICTTEVDLLIEDLEHRQLTS